MPMPSIPISIQIDRDINPLITGKTVSSARSNLIYEGQYNWHEGAFDRLDELVGATVIYVDSHCLLTDNGLRVEYGYNHGDLRFSQDGSHILFPKISKSVSHGHIVTLFFSDESAMAIRLYGWGTHFRITGATDKIKPTPFDAADPVDFTFDRFNDWLAERGNMNIIENCSTVKGALDIYNPVMCWILLQAGIHPRVKTRMLSQAEIEKIFELTTTLMDEYKNRKRTCAYNNLSGESIESDNDIIWMNAAMKGKPCPVCGAVIEAVACAGTKMYFCPHCQPLRK